jgi:hypothetical protein
VRRLGDIIPRLQVAALYAIAVWVPLQYLLTRQYELLPRNAVWLDEALLVLLAFPAVIAALKRPERARSPLTLPLTAFLAVALASAAYNRADLVELVLGLRAPLQCVVLAYVILLLEIPARNLARLGAITVALAALQAPFAVQQLAATYELVSRDEVVGTMWRGASNSLAYFLLMIMLPLAGYWLRRPRPRWPLAALAAMMIPFVFSSSRGAYYLAPVVVIATFWGQLRNHRRLHLLLAGAVVFSAALFAIYYGFKPTSPGSEVDAELSPRRVVREQLDHQGAMGRLYYLRWAADLLRGRGAPAVLLGVGPARFSSTSGAYLGAPLLAEATKGAHSSIIPSQLIATLSEFGVLGLAALSLAVVQGIGLLRAAARRLPEAGWRGWAEGAVGAGLFFVLATPLDNVWELQHVAYYFWGMVGAAAVMLRRGTA